MYVKLSQDIINNQNELATSCESFTYTANQNIGINNKILNSSGQETTEQSWAISNYFRVVKNETITLSPLYWSTNNRYCLYDLDKNLISCASYNPTPVTITINSDGYIRYNLRPNWNGTSSNPNTFVTERCINREEKAEETRKGILGKIGELLSYINPFSENFFVYKLIDLLEDLLKNLFIPSTEFLTDWFDELKEWIENKFGILSAPFSIFINFIQLYLSLEEQEIVINIPEITVPNFENTVLIQAQTFNWGELLRSKQSFLNMWNLYLDFIDVFIILNFLGLCETTYNRIFGGDTSQYEYYTTEETYNINDETGEATNHMLRQRRTRREKV